MKITLPELKRLIREAVGEAAGGGAVHTSDLNPHYTDDRAELFRRLGSYLQWVAANFGVGDHGDVALQIFSELERECLREGRIGAPSKAPSTAKIPLSFSDNEVGTEEFGFIPRAEGEDDMDDEDRRYQRHVRKVTGDNSWRVVNGMLYKSPPTK